MLRYKKLILLFLLPTLYSLSQTEGTKNFYPTIGIGSGVLSFKGDLNASKSQSLFVGRPAFDLHISKYIKPYLELNFYTLFGKLSVNERLADNSRNENFLSQIRLGGISASYNFNHFLKENRVVTPFVSIGIESFEFLSKTDLFDKNGNRYYYWSDGSIKNKDENATDAGSATNLQRDYTYETDIRELNTDGFGKYREQSVSIPIGIGAAFKLTDELQLKIGTTLHNTLTDYIDGIAKNGDGARKGNAGNDKFFMTSFSINYQLPISVRAKNALNTNYADVDYLALEVEDTDQDGVADIKDSCQGTPANVPVDKKGCPYDDDLDGIPNYVDKDQNSPKDSLVWSDGAKPIDSVALNHYLRYAEPERFAEVVVREQHGSAGFTGPVKKSYTVQLGIYSNGISTDLMTKYLSIGDVSSTFVNDSTAIYTSGNFSNYFDAENRLKELSAKNFKDIKIVYKQGDQFFEVPDNQKSAIDSVSLAKENPIKTGSSTTNTANTSSKPANTSANNGTSTNNTANETGVVFRIQLGAYSKKLSVEKVFSNIQNVIEIRQEGNLYKYLAGSFKTMQEAAKYKVDLITKGYDKTIIAAYKDGQRVTLGSAGASLTNTKQKEDITETIKPTSAINKNFVVFNVQLGAYKEEPPYDVQFKLKAMKDKGLFKERTSAGLTRYLVGSFNNYKAAIALKNEMVKSYGFVDAFIIAKFNNEYIPLQEALELVK